jgi:restriction endonuclease Mrr
MQEEPHLPNRADLEVPLLRILMAMGGKVHFASRGRQIEIELARVAKVSDEDRDFASPNYHSEGNRKWRNHIQFVREQLVKKGHLDNHTRGYWIVSEAGMRRIGASKDSVQPDPVRKKNLLDLL